MTDDLTRAAERVVYLWSDTDSPEWRPAMDALRAALAARSEPLDKFDIAHMSRFEQEGSEPRAEGLSLDARAVVLSIINEVETQRGMYADDSPQARLCDGFLHSLQSRLDAATRSAEPRAEGLRVLDWSYGKTPTYDVPGHCLTCGATFSVRREKGMKPPLNVECPDCKCTEYSWRIYPLAATPPAPVLDVERLATWLEHAFGPDVDWARHPDPMTRESWLVMARATIRAALAQEQPQ